MAQYFEIETYSRDFGWTANPDFLGRLKDTDDNLFSSREEADEAVRSLVEAGFPEDCLRVIEC